MTDLTTVFLGFGILTANNSWQCEVDESMVAGSSTGYLSPREFCFLLALQLRLREADRASVRQVTKHLESEQIQHFRRAWTLIDEQVDGIREQMSLPSRSEWAAPRGLDDILQPLPPYSPGSVDLFEAPKWNEGGVVNRAKRTKSQEYSFLGLVLFGLPGLILANTMSAPEYAVIAGLMGLVLGLLVGRKPIDYCSEPDCNIRLPIDASRCPGCGGRVTD